MFDDDKINRMRKCCALLPEPGEEVVRECLDEIERLRKDLSTTQENLRACTCAKEAPDADEAPPQWECTVCGNVGTGPCHGKGARKPLNATARREHIAELDAMRERNCPRISLELPNPKH
jgi:hypothetical protein